MKNCNFQSNTFKLTICPYEPRKVATSNELEPDLADYPMDTVQNKVDQYAFEVITVQGGTCYTVIMGEGSTEEQF